MSYTLTPMDLDKFHRRSMRDLIRDIRIVMQDPDLFRLEKREFDFLESLLWRQEVFDKGHTGRHHYNTIAITKKQQTIAADILKMRCNELISHILNTP